MLDVLYVSAFDAQFAEFIVIFGKERYFGEFIMKFYCLLFESRKTLPISPKIATPLFYNVQSTGIKESCLQRHTTQLLITG